MGFRVPRDIQGQSVRGAGPGLAAALQGSLDTREAVRSGKPSQERDLVEREAGSA